MSVIIALSQNKYEHRVSVLLHELLNKNNSLPSTKHQRSNFN